MKHQPLPPQPPPPLPLRPLAALSPIACLQTWWSNCCKAEGDEMLQPICRRRCSDIGKEV